jgi:predicted glycoside hydrolase/deacetylase ChbG (UPF0249 family)
MARAARSSEAALLASAYRNLGVGCHVVLVDGEPVLPPSELPTLVDPATGRFRAKLGAFVRDLALGRIRPQEIAAEAAAQIGHLRSLGVALTHLDTHKHTHIFPRVLDPLLEAAKLTGIRAIRNPFEPQWSLEATPNAPWIRRTQVHLLNRFRQPFLRGVAKAGLVTTGGAIGVLATGTLDSAALSSLLRNLPDGTWELVTHPGYYDANLDNAGTRLLASRQRELDALAAAKFPGEIEPIHFGQLAAPES